MTKRKFNPLTPPFDLVTNSISELTNDVTILAPAVDDFLYYNGTIWVNKELNTTTYWFNDTLLSEAAYEISKTPNNGTEDIDTIIVNNNTNFLEGYITSTVLGINNLVAGNWKFNLYTSVDTANGITTISAKIMKRILGTTGRLLVVTGTGTERNCYDNFWDNGPGYGFVPGDANIDPLLSNCVELNSATGTKGVFDIITYINSANVTIKVPADFVNSDPFHPDYIIHKKLFTVTSDEINELTKTLHTINSSQLAYKLNVTDGTEGQGYQSQDKLSVRLYATTDNIANTTVSFYHNSISSSNIIAPINPYQVTLELTRLADNILNGSIILNNNFLLSDTTGIGQIGFDNNEPLFYSGLVSSGTYSSYDMSPDQLSIFIRNTNMVRGYLYLADWGIDLGFSGTVGSGEIYIDDWGLIIYALGSTAIEIGANISLKLPTEITNTLGVTGESTFSSALKSDVLTGTAPLTIASTTKCTNLNVDLLDGLHDTGFTKTTAGQTINVSTAAELTAALAGLAAAPSLLENVIISCAAGTYTGNFTIPALLFNGFSLTIEGALSSLLSSQTATGGSALSGTALPTIIKTGAGWTVDAYRNKILKLTSGANSGKYRIIDTNTADTITFCGDSTALGATPANGDTFEVYDWGTSITSSSLTTLTGTSVKGINLNYLYIAASGASGSPFYFVDCVLNVRGCSILNGGVDYNGEANNFFTCFMSATGSYRQLGLRMTNVVFYGCKWEAPATAGYIALNLAVGYTMVRNGSVFDGYGNAIYAETGGIIRMLDGSCVFVRNAISVGIYLISGSGGQTVSTVNYSGNTSNYSADASSWAT